MSSKDFHWFSPRSVRVLVPLALISTVGLYWVEQGKRWVESPFHAEMKAAAELSARGAALLKTQRLERGVFVDPVNDPAETALIGQEYTQITTDRGYLDAKLASTDPNFAAVVVHMLREMRVESGDCVAVAATGSFPALNLSTLAAVESVGAKAALISSVGASNFGATDPYFTWLDMERELVDGGVLKTRSLAASLGGGRDVGQGLSPKGRRLLQEAIERNEVPLVLENALEKSIRERERLYREACGDDGVAAYVNLGGGVASLGHSLNGELVPTGATQLLPQRNYPVRGTLMRIAADGVPVINLLNVRSLGLRYGLVPFETVLPSPGQGEVFGEVRYDLMRTGLVTAIVLGLLFGIYRFDQRIHRLGQPGPENLS